VTAITASIAAKNRTDLKAVIIQIRNYAHETEVWKTLLKHTCFMYWRRKKDTSLAVMGGI
jgi:hypothetical protein